MPKYSGVTFSILPIEKAGKVSGYVVSGFMTKKQLGHLRGMIDSPDYKGTKMWRGEYKEWAQAVVGAIDSTSK